MDKPTLTGLLFERNEALAEMATDLFEALNEPLEPYTEERNETMFPSLEHSFEKDAAPVSSDTKWMDYFADGSSWDSLVPTPTTTWQESTFHFEDNSNLDHNYYPDYPMFQDYRETHIELFHSKTQWNVHTRDNVSPTHLFVPSSSFGIDNGDTYWSDHGSELIPTTIQLPPSPQTPSSSRSTSQVGLFSYVPVIMAQSVVDMLKDAVCNPQTEILKSWPDAIPAEQFFLGNVDIGTVDFGGKKAGTSYLVDDNYGILVNYSGDSSTKMQHLYPKHPCLKIWRMLLIVSNPPLDDSASDWKLQELRGKNSQVYFYSKLAMYVFGGEMYCADTMGRITQDCRTGAASKSYIPLGPSNRETRKRSHEQTNDGTSVKKYNHTKTKKNRNTSN